MTTYRVASGHTRRDFAVTSGNTLDVLPGGTALAAVVSSGGTLIVHGFDQGTTDDGTEIVHSGGVASFTTLDAYNSIMTVTAGGTAVSVSDSAGEMTILSGGLASGTGVTGQMFVSAGGTAIDTTVFDHGEIVVDSGTAVNTSLLVYTYELVTDGGRAIDTTLYGDFSATVQAVVSGGTTFNTSLTNFADQYVSAGGTAIDTTLAGGEHQSVQDVLSGGTAVGTQAGSYTLVNVSAGGVVADTTLSAPGVTDFGADAAALAVDGIATGTVVSAGGVEFVEAGGIDERSVISAGGHEFIASAGVVGDGTVVSGGKLTVSAGGAVLGSLTLSGGLAVIAGSVTAQAVTFAAAGSVLDLGNLPAFSADIAGFVAGERIDLTHFAFGSESLSFTEAADRTSGTLTVIDGGQQAHLTLLGAYATGNFQLSAAAAGQSTGVTVV